MGCQCLRAIGLPLLVILAYIWPPHTSLGAGPLPLAPAPVPIQRTLYAADDTYVDEGFPNTNYAGTHLKVATLIDVCRDAWSLIANSGQMSGPR